MNYATHSDLVVRFGQFELETLAPDDNGGIDTAKVEAAIADATADMNSYLGQRYALPISGGGPILVAVCCDIARYYLYSANPTEDITQRYTQRVAWLKDIANHKATLGIAEGSAQEPDTLSISTRSPGRIFTKDTLAGF